MPMPFKQPSVMMSTLSLRPSTFPPFPPTVTPTLNASLSSALEAHCASIAGKEAGVFVPSGTAGNQIALRSHLKQPPHTVLCDYRAHIYRYEAGGAGFHSGAAVTAVVPTNGHHLTVEDVERAMIYGPDVHLHVAFCEGRLDLN
jgi:threonine aldolase